MIQKAFKFRLYPNKEQETFFLKSFGCVRFVYNWGLEKRNQEYANSKKSISYVDMCNVLTQFKKTKPWLEEVNAQSLQSSLKNLDIAFTNFFKKHSKYPKYKSKYFDQSFQMPQNVSISENKLFIPKLKQGIRIKLSRTFDGKIKTTTISRNSYGQYFASILVETTENKKDLESFDSSKVLGIDLGIRDFAVYSDGTRISNPHLLKKELKRIKKLQQRVSRKVKGSKNRNKARKSLAHLHLKISNQRSDFLHKLTHDLTCKNQARTIVIEDLNVSGMQNNHHLAQSISDVSWSEFRRFLTYKCDWYGKRLIVIDRFEPSSKLCPECGCINDSLTLDQRTWTCYCGAVHDRDLLAANNIKNFGIIKYRRDYGNSNACGERDASDRSMKQEAQCL